jgi:hypothetical protein
MKPMKLSTESKKEILEEIIENVSKRLDDGTLYGGKFEYKTEYVWETEEGLSPMHIELTSTAYMKIMALVLYNTGEVGWHGTVDRIDDTHFVIEDILVYPQKVTGSTVTPDYDAYAQWQAELPLDVFKKIRFHGHSHVNMGTSPSQTDVSFQNDTVSMLRDDDFYIFMIINKNAAFNLMVHDLKTNTFYEAKSSDTKPEIYLELHDSVGEMKTFLQESKKLISTVTAGYNYAGSNYSGYSNYGTGNYGYKSTTGSKVINSGKEFSKSSNNKGASSSKSIITNSKETSSSGNNKSQSDTETVSEELLVNEKELVRALGISYPEAIVLLEDVAKDYQANKVKNDYTELIDYAWDMYELHSDRYFEEGWSNYYDYYDSYAPYYDQYYDQYED